MCAWVTNLVRQACVGVDAFPWVSAWQSVYSTQKRQPLPGQECDAADITILGNTSFRKRTVLRVLLEPTSRVLVSLLQDHHDPG